MKLPLIFYYHRLNTYSFNALAGAIDAHPSISDLSIDIALTEEQLRTLTAVNLNRYGRTLVCLSVMTCQFASIQRIVRVLQSDFGSHITIVAGGPHVTACPDDVLGIGVDIAFRGEAEVGFPETIQTLTEGQKVHNIQSPMKPVDIDAFHSFSPRRGMFGPIEITRGCAFACRYCQTSLIFGAGLRHRSIDNIVRQAKNLPSTNRTVVRLLSPNAFSYGSEDGLQLNLTAIRELLAAIRKTVTAKGKIIFAHFPSEARPEHITPDTIDLLKEFADNDEIVIGAQSGSNRMLEVCNRSHTVEDVLNAVSMLRRSGYKVIVDFIFGLPEESEEDIRETLAVIEDLVRMGARIHPHIFSPLPQTAFSKERPGIISPLVKEALKQFQSRRGLYENSRAQKLEDFGLK